MGREGHRTEGARATLTVLAGLIWIVVGSAVLHLSAGPVYVLAALLVAAVWILLKLAFARPRPGP